MSTRVVRFVRPSGCYTPGDVARLPSTEAVQLWHRQVVQWLDESVAVPAEIGVEPASADTGAVAAPASVQEIGHRPGRHPRRRRS